MSWGGGGGGVGVHIPPPPERPKYGVRSVDDISKAFLAPSGILEFTSFQKKISVKKNLLKKNFFFNIFFWKEVNSKIPRGVEEQNLKNGYP